MSRKDFIAGYMAGAKSRKANFGDMGGTYDPYATTEYPSPKNSTGWYDCADQCAAMLEVGMSSYNLDIDTAKEGLLDIWRGYIDEGAKMLLNECPKYQNWPQS